MRITQEELAAQKKLHTGVRAAMHAAARGAGPEIGTGAWKPRANHRTMLLVWGFVRGFKYRRIERSHHVQELPDGQPFEHNMPSMAWLAAVVTQLVGGAADENLAKMKAWLEDPTGAITAPPPRAKKPFARDVAAE